MVDEFKEQVKKGFSACRDDISELKENISSLKFENLNLKKEISSLSETIIELRGEIKGIKIALDYIKEMKTSTTPIVENSNVKRTDNRRVQKIETQMDNSFKDPYEALLAFKAKNNKRELLKQKMMSMVGENGMNLSELKFMIVEHFKFCSKASFYNYLKELEIENTITIRRENSKNTVYMNTIKTSF